MRLLLVEDAIEGAFARSLVKLPRRRNPCEYPYGPTGLGGQPGKNNDTAKILRSAWELAAFSTRNGSLIT